jgi:hypothetical protein
LNCIISWSTSVCLLAPRSPIIGEETIVDWKICYSKHSLCPSSSTQSLNVDIIFHLSFSLFWVSARSPLQSISGCVEFRNCFSGKTQSLSRSLRYLDYQTSVTI